MAVPTIESVTASSGNCSFGSTWEFDFTLDNSDNSGDLLLFGVANDGGDRDCSMTGAGYTRLGSDLNAVVNLWVKSASGSEGSTAQATFNAYENVAGIVWRVSGWSGTLADVEVTSTSHSGDTSPDCPAITPSFGSGDYLFITCMGNDDGRYSVSTWPTNYSLNQTEEIGLTNNSGAQIAMCGRTVASVSTEDPDDFHFGTGLYWYTYTIAIPASAGGGGSSPKPSLALMGVGS